MDAKDIVPVMLDLEHVFEIAGERIAIVPQSLGAVHLCASILARLNVNMKVLASNAPLEAIRLAHTDRHTCAQLVAYRMEREKDTLLDAQKMECKTRFISENTSDGDLALLVLLVLSDNKIAECMDALGITKEHQRMEKAKEAKSSANTFTFGGKTIYGAVIGAACEKYGWTYDYAVWGISYMNLQLLIADSVVSMYLTDEEKASAGLGSTTGKTIKITKDNLQDIARMFRQ